mmetsp:Transcript_43813/g.111962  ORF Transcript_43813/g.111962 Transcript_43813/m.111962 type:complete len:261 (+) Transcript_43813:357-1139(+)|eukprot:jgi/Tetstr1/424327/TSEL_014894.t2
MGCASSTPETQEGGHSGAATAASHPAGEAPNPVFTGQSDVAAANGGDTTFSVEELLSGARVPSMQPQKRSARRSTDSEFVENLDVFNYTDVHTELPGKKKPPSTAKLTFETDGVNASFEVGKATSMDKLLRGARAATYSGPMSGDALASAEELADRRRSYLEKITLPMLVESDGEGNTQYDFQATHNVTNNLQWNEYFKQEGSNAPRQVAPAPTPSPSAQPSDIGGVLSLEQLLNGTAETPESAAPAAAPVRASRRASAM